MVVNLEKLEIRKAEDKDKDYLLKMLRRVTAQENVKFLCSDIVNEYIESGKCDKGVMDSFDLTQLLIHEDKIIGYGAWRDNYLEALMLDNEYYGTGAATWFMEKMQDKMFMEYDVLKLDVFEENSRAFKFYEKLGWHVYGYHIQDIIGVKLWDFCILKDEKVNTENLQYRKETMADYWMVENLTREAFWNQFVAGCHEHYLMNRVRGSKSFIEELDIVAELEDYVVGNIVYTKAKIIEDCGKESEVLSFGPLSVHPNFHGRGIGSRLIQISIEKAREMGYKAVLIYGNPGYYSRLGFVPAEKYGIGTPDNMYMDSLQAFEIEEGSLKNSSGTLHVDDVFVMDQKKLAEFDSGFPFKVKFEGLDSQKRFAEAIKKQKARK